VPTSPLLATRVPIQGGYPGWLSLLILCQAEDHVQTLKREEQKKKQLDEETMMVARDVRALRNKRKEAEEAAKSSWKQAAI